MSGRDRARRGIRVALLLALASAALPAEAHVLGIGIVVRKILLITWPVVGLGLTLSAPAGSRLVAFAAALVGYPVTYFMMQKFLVYRMRDEPDARIDDAQWFVMLVQWGIWGAIAYFVARARNNADSP